MSTAGTDQQDPPLMSNTVLTMVVPLTRHQHIILAMVAYQSLTDTMSTACHIWKVGTDYHHSAYASSSHQPWNLYTYAVTILDTVTVARQALQRANFIAASPAWPRTLLSFVRCFPLEQGGLKFQNSNASFGEPAINQAIPH